MTTRSEVDDTRPDWGLKEWSALLRRGWPYAFALAVVVFDMTYPFFVEEEFDPMIDQFYPVAEMKLGHLVSVLYATAGLILAIRAQSFFEHIFWTALVLFLTAVEVYGLDFTSDPRIFSASVIVGALSILVFLRRTSSIIATARSQRHPPSH